MDCNLRLKSEVTTIKMLRQELMPILPMTKRCQNIYFPIQEHCIINLESIELMQSPNYTSCTKKLKVLKKKKKCPTVTEILYKKRKESTHLIIFFFIIKE